MRERETSLVALLIRALIPSWGPTLLTSYKPHFLPKASFLDIITLGIRDSIYDLGGRNSVHSIS